MSPRPHPLALPTEATTHYTACQDSIICHPSTIGTPACPPPAASSPAAAAPAPCTSPYRPVPTEDIPCSPRTPVLRATSEPALVADTATAADSATAQWTSEPVLGANSPTRTPAMGTTGSTSCESACGSPGSLLALSPASTVSGNPALSPIRSPCFDSPASTTTTTSPSALPKPTETPGPLHSRRALCFEPPLQQQMQQPPQQAPPAQATPSQPEPSATTLLLNKLIAFLPPSQPEQTAWKHTATIAHEVSRCSGAGDLMRPGKELAAFAPQRTLQHSGGPLPRVTQAGTLPDGTTVVQKRVAFEVSQVQLLNMQVAHLSSGLQRNTASSGAASAAASSSSSSSPYKPAVPEYAYRELRSYMAVTERLRAVDPALLMYVVPIQRWGVVPDVEWNTAARSREGRDAPLRFELVIETELAQYGSLRQCMKLMGEAARNRTEWPCYRWLLGLMVGKAQALQALRRAGVLLPDNKFENAVVDPGCRVRLIDLDGARLLPLPSGEGSFDGTSSAGGSSCGCGCAVVRTAKGGSMPVALWPHPFTPDYAAPEMLSNHVSLAMAYGGTVEELLEAAELKKDMPALGRLVEGVRSGALGPSQLQELGVKAEAAAGEEPQRCAGVPHVSYASQVHQFGVSVRVGLGELRSAVEGRLAEQGPRKPWSLPYDGCLLKPWDMRLIEDLGRLADECTALLPSARPDAGQLVERLGAMLRKVEAAEAREGRALSGVQRQEEGRGQKEVKKAARKEAAKAAKGTKPAWRI